MMELLFTTAMIVIWSLCGFLIVAIGMGLHSYLKRFGLV